jgi:N1-aminopropylagmatine ureohydrolase
MNSLGSRPEDLDIGAESDNALQFLGLPPSDPRNASVHLLPVPLEATVSYGHGTSGGPSAILQASSQVELYDREFDCEPALIYGVHTFPEWVLSSNPETALHSIAKRVEAIYDPSVLLGVLGGEHSLTSAVVRGILSRLEGPITVVQLDAHADLRDTYDNTPHSHACVARRLLELDRVEQILQLGIRSLCSEEADIIKSNRKVRTWFSEDVHRKAFESELRERVRGRNVYLTVDVDGYDPTLISSTGTPEPDGLTYAQGESIFRMIAEEAHLVGFDCVELAPVKGQHVSDFVTAKLVYRLMNLFLQDKVRKNKGEHA